MQCIREFTRSLAGVFFFFYSWKIWTEGVVGNTQQMARDVISSEIPTDRDTPPHYSDAPKPTNHPDAIYSFFFIV